MIVVWLMFATSIAIVYSLFDACLSLNRNLMVKIC
nr:MAG TPA: hypothetical protein [Caudoviricetes sp.]